MNYRGRGDAPLRFETTPRVALGLPRARDARIAARSGRLLHVLSVQDMGGRARLVAQRSSDGGDSFSPPVPISVPGAQVLGSGESAHALCLSSSGLCTAWSQARSGGSSELMFSFSPDGERWMRPICLSDRPDVYHGYPALAAAPDGTLWAAASAG